MLEIIVELLACLLFGVLTLMIASSIVGSIVAALRAVGRGSVVNRGCRMIEIGPRFTTIAEIRSGLVICGSKPPGLRGL